MEEPLWRTPAGRLAPEHVYRMAGALGAELQRLSGRFGPEAVAGLVPQVVRLLELLEALAGPAGAESSRREPAETLLRTLQSLCGERRREEAAAAPGASDLEQKLSEAQRKEHVLQNQLAQLEEENQKLLAQLTESQSQEDSTLRKEREVMLRLKEVVDKQRDEIRAQAHEIVCKNHDTEALQEQLNRFMSMNEDLRHKLAVVQVQLKSALEKKEDLETMVLENRREIDRLSRAASGASPRLNMDGAAAPVEELQHQDWGRNSAPSCFSKEELKQILQERNELKTSLFLVQEELAYYQRELLNDERIPSFLLDAMKSTIKKQRKKIRAKMLGIVEEPASSDEDESADCVDSRPRESKIKSFFDLWYHSSSKDPPNPGCSGVWEIIDSQDVHFEQEEENKPTHGSPDRVVPPP
ncbi:rab-interacting lysosomal protein-like isoform X3 [Gopherus evgoodei]|uniref:Rab interacting lysosomal protein n=1 Tax=Gopherus evgoodei TaxID=1825980 RepID=A0A8C4W5Y2_9SAUR|nr:rab-interacting lysosomal protein-like isoform X3 [Gopherus evgoodei]